MPRSTVQNYHQKKQLSWKQNQIHNFNDQYLNLKRNQIHNFESKQRSNLKQKKFKNCNQKKKTEITFIYPNENYEETLKMTENVTEGEKDTLNDLSDQNKLKMNNKLLIF